MHWRNIAILLGLCCATVVHAQQPEPAAPTAVTVPKLVRFSGSFRLASGTPAQTMESVTLSVYRDQTGGDALWHEIQNVVVDSDGHYSVLMGATKNEGMPVDLFSSGEPRWLGVQFNRPGEAEQPRSLLASVPYALKASDAETLGGKPASAYLLAAPEAATSAVGADAASIAGVTASTTNPATKAKPKATPQNNGQPNYIGKFTNTTDLIDSAMYELNGNIGIGTTHPITSLDARTYPFSQIGMAQTVDYLTFFSSDCCGPAIYWNPTKDMRFGKGGSGLYNPYGFVEQMRIQSSNGNVGIGTQSPAYKLDVAGDVNLSGSLRYLGTPVLQLPGGGAKGNTATGLSTLVSITTGSGNTATGYLALQSNTTGLQNTAGGLAALEFNTTGNNNTADGAYALFLNTTGFDNTATGFQALENNTGGTDNVADGYLALQSNTIGVQNTAIGSHALQNTTGNFNTGVGTGALFQNTTGSNNTSLGASALQSNTSGQGNIAIGANAAINVSGGNGGNIHIGNLGSSNDSATIRIGTLNSVGAFFVAGVRGKTTGSNDAIPVLIDSNGQMGTVSSSRRFKEDIEDMGAASRDLMRLRPVTYRYKDPFADGSKPIQYGLIAEEVAEVYPDLVAHSADGQIETVKYQVLDSMLLNEVQRQQTQIRGLEQQNQSLQERLARLETALASIDRIPGAR